MELKFHFETKNLSGSQTGIIDVIKHAIISLENKNVKFKFVCCIFATAPFIEKKLLIRHSSY